MRVAGGRVVQEVGAGVMSCVDEAVCGRFGPPTFAQHLGQLIEQIDRVQKRVRDMQEEETLQLIRECEQKHRERTS